MAEAQGWANKIGETTEAGAGHFYDRIARFYNLTFKLNGYGRSIERYLRTHPLPLDTGARVLDAGCGTGLLTLALLKALTTPSHITALDLSASSIATARHAIFETARTKHRVSFLQANVLSLPFSDGSFNFIVTSGALEYVPLDEGMSELARVLAPGGYFLHLPVYPSPMTTILEYMFHFKSHTPQEVMENTSRYFRLVEHHRFPLIDPISWSKTAVLAQKA